MEGRKSLNDDIGGGTFWERNGVKSALPSRIIERSEGLGDIPDTCTHIHP